MKRHVKQLLLSHAMLQPGANLYTYGEPRGVVVDTLDVKDNLNLHFFRLLRVNVRDSRPVRFASLNPHCWQTLTNAPPEVYLNGFRHTLIEDLNYSMVSATTSSNSSTTTTTSSTSTLPSPCQTEPCLNGGTCSDDLDSFKCTCPALYAGTRCQQGQSCTKLPDSLQLSTPAQFAAMIELGCQHYLGRLSLLPRDANDSVLIGAVLQSLKVVERGLVIAGPVSVSVASLQALELGAALNASDTALSANVSSLDFGLGTVSLHDIFTSIVSGKLSVSSQQPCPSEADIGVNPFWWAGLDAVNLVFADTAGCTSLFPAEGSCVSACELCPVICSPEQLLDQLRLSTTPSHRCEVVTGSLELVGLTSPESQLRAVLGSVSVVVGSLSVMDFGQLVSLSFLAQLERVDGIVLQNNLNLLDARLPSLMPNVPIVSRGNTILCSAGMPYGHRACEGVVQIDSSFRLENVSSDTIQQLASPQGQSLLATLFEEQLHMGSLGTTAAATAANQRRRETTTHLDVKFTLQTPSKDAANITYFLQVFDVAEFIARLRSFNASVSAVVITVPFDETVNLSREATFEQSAAVTLRVESDDDSILLTWIPPKLDNQAINASFQVLIQPAATDGDLTSLQALGALSRDQALLLYSELIPRRVMTTEAGSLTAKLATCSSIVVADKETNCLRANVIYEIMIVATDASGLLSGTTYYSQPLLIQQTALDVLSVGTARASASSVDLQWRQPHGASTSVSVLATSIWGLPGERGKSFDLSVLLDELQNSASGPVQSLAIAGCYQALPMLTELPASLPICIEPYTEYRISLTSISPRGHVSQAGTVIVTAEVAPKSSIINASVNLITATGAMLRGVIPEQLTGRIVSVKLTIKSPKGSVTSTWPLEGLIPSDRVALPLEGLTPYTAYSVQARLTNAQGEGPIGDIVLFTTRQGVPSKPLNAILTVWAEDRVTLAWTTPAALNGLLLAYEITITTMVTNETNTTWLVAPSVTTANISLSAADDRVWIRAQTAAGFGPYSAQAVYLVPSAADPEASRAQSAAPFIATGVFLVACMVALLALWRHRQHLKAKYRPIPDDWELLREQVELLKVIGSGAHGEVWLGVSLRQGTWSFHFPLISTVLRSGMVLQAALLNCQ